MKTLLIICIIFLVPIMAIASSVTLEPAIGGFWDDGGSTKLIPYCDITLNLRIINNNGVNAGGITNGFRVYGPSNFFPPTVTVIDPNFSTSGYFDLVFTINYFSADGIGADTVGVGGSKLTGSGLPDGYNDIAYSITTGGVPPGETLCIDSSFFPPTGQWLWVPGSSPTWGGPYCYLAETVPCIPVYIDNWADTLTFYGCDTLQYHFNAIDDVAKCKSSIKDSEADHIFKLWDGPGTIDATTGDWFFIAGTDDLNTYQTLSYGVYDLPYCLGSEYQTVIEILDSVMPGDINQSCTVDVGDVVFLVDFMFDDGEPPMVMSDADVDGNGVVDIADLVYFVAYQFGGGPPPVG